MPPNALMQLVHRFAERSGLARAIRLYDAGLRAEAALSPGQRLLFRARHSYKFPLAVALLSIIASGSSLFPFGPVIAAATVFAPHRWRSIIIASTLGAAIGATGLTCALRQLGNGVLNAYFPDVQQTALWAESAYWIGHHGMLALGVITALPVPQIPALVVAALSDMSLPLIGLAVAAGKATKYLVYVFGLLLVLRAMRHLANWRENE